MTQPTAMQLLDAAFARRGAGDPPARLHLILPPSLGLDEARRRLVSALPGEAPEVTVVEGEEALLTLPRRTIPLEDALEAAEPAQALAAVLASLLDGAMVQPDLPRPGAPERPFQEPGLESVDDFPPGCWVGEEDLKGRSRWALEMIAAPQAWAFSVAAGRPVGGDGIVVAQPDTGVATHAQLEGVVRFRGFNTLGDGAAEDPTDPLQAGFALNPGHGTATASVVVSPESGAADAVVGSAPKALHMPIRAIRSTWLHEEVAIARAVDVAVQAGAHVITMSLGGLVAPISPLRRAIGRAIARDVIVMAAAGNCVDVVVWPARFPECLAVAGVDREGRRWPGSCHGPAVDISAPAQNVLRAAVAPGGRQSVGQGQGTSYAVALTAGVAACWLAHHGRDVLIAEARSRGETLQAMLRRLLRATATRSDDWDAVNMGAGIVNARALLKAPLDLGFGVEAPATLAEPAGPAEDMRGMLTELLGADPGLPDAVLLAHGSDLAGKLLAAKLRVGGRIYPNGTPAAPGLVRPAVEQPPARERRIETLRREFASGRALGAGGTLESAAAAEELPKAAALRQRLDEVIGRMPLGEVKDRAAFERVLRLLLEHAPPALDKLPDPAAEMTDNELGALEAVVKADGSRPSLLIREDWVMETHPFIGGWADQLVIGRPRLKEVIRMCGRIQPTGGHASRFAGTGTLLDPSGPWVLTNFHVLNGALARFPIPHVRSATGLRITRGLEIDFGGETESLEQNRWTIVEAVLPARAGEGFGVVDAVLLRLGRSLDGKRLPLPEPDPGEAPRRVTLSSSGRYLTGQAPDFVSIGFPAKPPRIAGEADGIDWGWVVGTLFGNEFGVKRLAPGLFHRPLGSAAGDVETRLAFGHDATTLKGASGSLLFAFRDPGAPAFGLHFAGFDNDSNYAISVPALAQAFEGRGVALP
jgi:serine protease